MLECNAALELLERGVESPELAVHVATCSACASHQQLLAVLSRLPQPEPDQELVRQLSLRLPHPPWLLRRPATWFPAACGVMALAVGLAQGGAGLPGGYGWQLLGQAAVQSLWLEWGRQLPQLAPAMGSGFSWGLGLTALATLGASLWALRLMLGVGREQ